MSKMADDCQSFAGSLGGTLVSRHNRNGTVRSIDLLARNLRDYHKNSLGDIQAQGGTETWPSSMKKSVDDVACNRSFHHFRYLVIIMSGIAVGLMLMMRYGMSVSLLKMVNQTHLYLEDHPNKTVEDFLAEGYSLGGEFNWNNEIVSIILSWYMIAYTVPQMANTQLALKMGCRWSNAISIFICAISTVLTPAAAYFGWQYVVAMRFLNGFGASAMVALTLNIIELWMRHDEISLGLSITQGFAALSLCVTPLFTGYLTAIHWVYSFYVPGIISLVFCVLWFVLVSDTPETSPFISNKELHYLAEPPVLTPAQQTAIDEKKNQEQANGDQSNGHKEEDDELSDKPDSWLQIFKVPSFYAYAFGWTIACCVGHGYLFTLPTYLRQFLKISVIDNGFYGFIIQIGCFLPVVWPHTLQQIALRYGLSMNQARNINTTLYCLGVIATFIYVGIFHDHQIEAFFLNRCFFGAADILFSSSLMANYGKAGLSSVAFSIMNSISDILIVPTCTFIGWYLDYSGQSRIGWSRIFVAFGLSYVVLWAVMVLMTDTKPVKFRNKKTKQQKDIENDVK